MRTSNEDWFRGEWNETRIQSEYQSNKNASLYPYKAEVTWVFCLTSSLRASSLFNPAQMSTSCIQVSRETPLPLLESFHNWSCTCRISAYRVLMVVKSDHDHPKTWLFIDFLTQNHDALHHLKIFVKIASCIIQHPEKFDWNPILLCHKVVHPLVVRLPQNAPVFFYLHAFIELHQSVQSLWNFLDTMVWYLR